MPRQNDHRKAIVRFSIDLPDPVAAIKFRMEHKGLWQKELEKYFPGNNRVSETLTITNAR